MRTRAGSSGSNSRLERVRVSYSRNCIDNPACLAGRPIMGMIKDGRSQRWSLADNLWADAANGKKAAHVGHNGERTCHRQGRSLVARMERSVIRGESQPRISSGLLVHAQFWQGSWATVEAATHSQYS